MLPNEFAHFLKPPGNRVVNVFSSDNQWIEWTIVDLLFLPIYKELCPTGSDIVESSMKGYKYYSGAGDNDKNRVKYQIKGSEGSASFTEIKDARCTERCISYAGYDIFGDGGSSYWLSSPYINNDINAWFIDNNGSHKISSGANRNALGVAPCFCI